MTIKYEKQKEMICAYSKQLNLNVSKLLAMHRSMVKTVEEHNERCYCKTQVKVQLTYSNELCLTLIDEDICFAKKMRDMLIVWMLAAEEVHFIPVKDAIEVRFMFKQKGEL